MTTIRTPVPFSFPGEKTVHVWSALLSVCLSDLTSFASVLSVEERHRVDRFLHSNDRFRYIAAHGILRHLLGHYLAVAPAGLVFGQNNFGKPSLIQSLGQPKLSFNLAHSGDVLLFAFSAGRRVGVDVEAIRTDLDVMELAQSQFSTDEIQTLRAIDPSARPVAFFRCWTRKEACVKALGDGLSYPLKQFSVSFSGDESPKVVWMADDPMAHERWSVLDLAIAAGYAGAVVGEGKDLRFVVHRWVGAR